MSYAVEWSETALLRLGEQGDFIARRNPQAAAQLINDLFDRVNVLAEHPQAGPVFPGSSDNHLRELILDKYHVIYTVEDAKRRVYIVVVRHARERPLHVNEVLDRIEE